jgi:hypothetical protein
MASATPTASRQPVSSVRWLTGLVVASIIGCAAVPVAGGQASVRSDYIHLGKGVSSPVCPGASSTRPPEGP